MPGASVVVLPDFIIDNLQHTQRIEGAVTVTPGTGYEAGGIPFDSAILALPGVQTNSGIRYAKLISKRGTGYIYERQSNGNMMILQVPPAGSLTTAGPLQQLSSASNSLSEVAQDVIAFECFVLRNA